MRNVILGVVLVFILGVVGCTALLGGAAKKASDNIDKAKQDAMAEVALERCDSTAVGREAGGTVTNGSSKRSNYIIDVVFLDPAGNQVDSGSTGVNNVEPDQRAQWSAGSLNQATQDPAVTCKVADVTRYASP